MRCKICKKLELRNKPFICDACKKRKLKSEDKK